MNTLVWIALAMLLSGSVSKCIAAIPLAGWASFGSFMRGVAIVSWTLAPLVLFVKMSDSNKRTEFAYNMMQNYQRAYNEEARMLRYYMERAGTFEEIAARAGTGTSQLPANAIVVLPPDGEPVKIDGCRMDATIIGYTSGATHINGRAGDRPCTVSIGNETHRYVILNTMSYRRYPYDYADTTRYKFWSDSVLPQYNQWVR